MMDLSIVFPEINDPDWIRQREENWQIMLENSDIKSEYRKKDLEKIKRYFFNGEIEPDMPLQDAYIWLFETFPIQRREGYDYLFLNNDYTQEQVKDITLSALMDLSSSGLTNDQQLIHWDYHLGKEFSSQVTRVCQSGLVSVEVDPYILSKDYLILISAYLRQPSYSAYYKLSLRLSYVFSALIASSKYYSDLNDNPDFFESFEFLFCRILTKNFPACEGDPMNYRYIFAEEFVNRMEHTKGLPDRILVLWDKVKSYVDIP
ncbi:MAG: hypothetical protein P8X74_17570 [Reinekea sp.]